MITILRKKKLFENPEEKKDWITAVFGDGYGYKILRIFYGQPNIYILKRVRARVMVSKTIFNNVVVSFIEGGVTGVPGENHQPATNQRQTLLHNVVLYVLKKLM